VLLDYGHLEWILFLDGRFLYAGNTTWGIVEIQGDGLEGGKLECER
jgi:hypothetical protein